MKAAKPKPKTVEEYLERATPQQRAALEKIRRTIHAAAPGVVECISYGLAGFKFNGRPLVFLGAWENHCAFYPGSSGLAKEFQDQLQKFECSKGTIRFTPEKPLPTALVRKIVKARIAENRDRGTA